MDPDTYSHDINPIKNILIRNSGYLCVGIDLILLEPLRSHLLRLLHSPGELSEQG